MIFKKTFAEVLLLKKQLKHMTTTMIHMIITMKTTIDAKDVYKNCNCAILFQIDVIYFYIIWFDSNICIHI